MTEELKKYRELLGHLQRNKHGSPIEELRTRYRKSYIALLEEIRDMTRQLLQDIVLDGLQISQEGEEGIYLAINQAIEKSGLLMAIQAAVFQEQDADKVMEHAKQLRVIVHQAAGGMDG